MFDTQTSGVSLSLVTILPTAIGLGLLMFGLSYLAFQTRNVRKKVGQEDMIGHTGVVKSTNGNKGQVEVLGELWKYTSKDELVEGDEVQVTQVKGLKLTVKKGSV